MTSWSDECHTWRVRNYAWMGQLALSENYEVLVNRGAALEISYKVLGRCRLSGHLVYGTLTMTECYYF